jgi:dicarboxylate transporter 10
MRSSLPAQIVLVRMCTDAVRPPTQQYGYRNCFDGIYRVVRDEGFHVLYRGTGPNVLRSISMSECELALPEHSASTFSIRRHICS